MRATSLLQIVMLCVCVSSLALTAAGQQPRQDRRTLREPVYRVAQAPRQAQAAAATAEHPLAEVAAKAEELLGGMQRNVRDYSATLVKRERIDGELLDYQYINCKIRNERTNGRGEVVTPFSVYMNFAAPDEMKGREVIYVKGQNDDKLIAHDGGTGLIAAIKAAVTVNLDPTAPLAMKGNKYPITDVGMENLMVKLISVAKADMQRGEVDVKTFKGAKINGRVCTCLQSVHPTPREHFRYHIARIYVDDELQLPIRYESYDWPSREGEQPPLLEEYTYLNLKLNNGFTDADFDQANDSYNFN